MKALVIGAHGLIGCNIVRELRDAGEVVRGLVPPDCDLRGLATLGQSDVELIHGDWRDRESLTGAAEGCDVVFHLASVTNDGEQADRGARDDAIGDVREVIDAAHDARVERIVLTSSAITCGSTTTLTPRDERDALVPTEVAPDFHHATMETETVARARARELGVDLIVALPTTCVGWPDFLPEAGNGQLLAYLHDPGRSTSTGGCNVVSARDVARGHHLLARRGHPDERYVLGSENWEWSMIHRTISELCGIRGPGRSVSHTEATLLAMAREVRARLTQRQAQTTRHFRTHGRFYFYRAARARQLGFDPMPSRLAIADALGWLVTSEHVSARLRRSLRLSDEIYDARRAAGWVPPAQMAP